MKQIFKDRRKVLGLGILCAGGLYWLYYNTSWHFKSSTDYDQLNPPIQYFRKANGASATVRRFPVDDVKGLKASLDRRIFRWAQQRTRDSECYVSPLPAAYATAFISTGTTRRVIMYVAAEHYVDWIKMDFPNSSNYMGELSQFLRTEMKWKGSLSDFRRIKNDFIPYNFPIEIGRVIELPHDWYSVGEEVGGSPLFRFNSNAQSVHRTPQKISVSLYRSEVAGESATEEGFPEKELNLLTTHGASPAICSIKEYLGGEKQNFGRFTILKGTRKCLLNVRRMYYDSTDVLAEARPLAEHIAREWAKLPD
ncbi:MAG: hypothetical protein K8R88_03275 [Armatimonadetes bacterium]|nr:hypothetical protein [Armatimonadota bacterium]